jgi:CRP/FNR family transcriptional regulator, cyclic AMP receptor protein
MMNDASSEGGQDRSAELVAKLGRRFAAGTVIFRAGDPGHELFVIHSGKVSLTRSVRGQDLPLATLGKGDFFGELAVLNQQPRSATATALEDSELLVIDPSTLGMMMRGSSDIAVRLLKKLAERLANANGQVEALLRPDMNYRIVHHLRHLAQSHTRAAESVDAVAIAIDGGVEEISQGAGVPFDETRKCIERLERARLVALRPGLILVPQVGRLSQFLEFLESAER